MLALLVGLSPIEMLAAMSGTTAKHWTPTLVAGWYSINGSSMETPVFPLLDPKGNARVNEHCPGRK